MMAHIYFYLLRHITFFLNIFLILFNFLLSIHIYNTRILPFPFSFPCRWWSSGCTSWEKTSTRARASTQSRCFWSPCGPPSATFSWFGSWRPCTKRRYAPETKRSGTRINCSAGAIGAFVLCYAFSFFLNDNIFARALHVICLCFFLFVCTFSIGRWCAPFVHSCFLCTPSRCCLRRCAWPRRPGSSRRRFCSETSWIRSTPTATAT